MSQPKPTPNKPALLDDDDDDEDFTFKAPPKKPDVAKPLPNIA